MVIGENKKAVIWSGVDKVAGYIVHFGIQIILARLLMPEDYTVVAMLAIFLAISQAFIDSGFATTLIQKKNCTESDYSTVFYFNILISIIVYCILFLCAPAIERFYNFHNLASVTKVYSFGLVITAFGMVNRVILTKELKFKKIAIVSLVSSILSAIPAIILAFDGFGYWALVIQNLVSCVISVSLYFYYSRWRPRFIFSMRPIKSLAPFGLRILIIYVFHAIYNNIYSLLIGKRYPAADLGYYDRGKTLAGTAPIGFSDFFTRAIYPIQAKNQDSREFLESSYNRSFAISVIIIVPICIFLCVFSYQSIFTLLGNQWLDSTFILSILSIGYMFYPLQALNMTMLKVGGRADYLLNSEIIKKVLGIVAVIIAINYSLEIVVWSWTICAICEFIISEFYFVKLYHFRVFKTLKILVIQVILSLTASIVVLVLSKKVTDNNYLVFFCGGLLYLMIYLGISLGFNRHLLKLISKR